MTVEPGSEAHAEGYEVFVDSAPANASGSDGAADAKGGNAGASGRGTGSRRQERQGKLAEMAYRSREAKRTAEREASARRRSEQQVADMAARLARLEAKAEVEESRGALRTEAEQAASEFRSARQREAEAKQRLIQMEQDGADAGQLADARAEHAEAVSARRDAETVFAQKRDRFERSAGDSEHEAKIREAENKARATALRDAWLARNSWYLAEPSENDAPDPRVAAVQQEDQKIRREKTVAVGSPEYWAKLDEAVDKAQAGATDDTDGTDTGANSDRSSPPLGSARPGAANPERRADGRIAVRLTASQRAVARSMKLSDEDYAKAMLDAQKRGEI